MDWGKVKFFLAEVLRSFTRNAAMQLTAIGTVAITIVILGGFLFTRSALNGLGTQLLDQIEISAYLANDASPAQEHALERLIATDPRVQSVQFVSKQQGLKELRARTQGSIDTSLLTENPLPDKLRIRVRRPDDVPAVAAGIKRLNGVQTVVYGQAIVARLLQLGAVLRRIGLVTIAVFLLVAAIIISNTIRLTVFARRREIAIMQLVGATNTYIRLPFVCEGMLSGAIGAIVALILLAIAHAALWPRLVQALPFVELRAGAIDPFALAGEMLVVGAAVGAVAASLSVGRHLRV